MRRFGVRAKLTLSYAALLVLVVAALGGVFASALSTELDRAIDQRLEHLCTGLWGYFDFGDGDPVLVYNPEDHSILDFLRTAARYYQLYDGQTGRVLSQSEDSALMHLALSPSDAVMRTRAPGVDETFRLSRLRFRSMAFHARTGRLCLLRVGVSLSAEQTALREIRRLLLLLLPVTVVGGAIVGWFMADRALKPVQQLRLAAHDIGISQLNRRLPSRGTGDELDLLAATFNGVFARLEESVDKMREFTASISHELRTPLACLQGEAELALTDAHTTEACRRMLASQLEEFGKLNRLIERLLMLARAESGEIELASHELDLSALVVGLVDQIHFIADSRHINLRLRCDTPVFVVGDPQWLERAALNLIDNALKFTRAGGEVTLETVERDGRAVLKVSDTGVGISPQDIGRVFDRFYRADGSRSKEVEGIGLGLTITKWIVEAHGGTIHVESQPDIGSAFTVDLPALAAASV